MTAAAGARRRGAGAARWLAGGALAVGAATAAIAEPAAAAAAPASSAASAPPTGEWAFRALLDGSPIGEHRFSVSGQGDERRVVSEARFEVRIIGITAYRYHHRATERWRGECLTALQSSTDDDGKPSAVRAERDGAALHVEKPDDAVRAIPGCVMSFAYWNPAIRHQTRMLNAQTGKLETVQVQRAGSAAIEVRGQPVQATEYRISGAAQPIGVWYTAEGLWVGLDSIVAGGRKLSYRLF